MTQRNNKVNNGSRLRLYHNICVGLWIHQISLQSNNSWFELEKKIVVDLKAIQQIEFIRQLKDINSLNAGGVQSMFVLTVLRNIKETQIKFC